MPQDPQIDSTRLSRRESQKRVVGPGFHRRVYAVVRAVPKGRVTTYGDVAEALGLRRAARHVGWALAALDGSDPTVPWHRVVNGAGKLTCAAAEEQRRRLREEGVDVDERGKVRGFAGVRVAVEELRSRLEWQVR